MASSSQTNGDQGLTQSNIPVNSHTAPTESQQLDAGFSPSTLAVHADDPLNLLLADVAPPIHVSTTFRYTNDPSQLRPFRASDRGDLGLEAPYYQETTEHVYSRETTHNMNRLEAILTSLIGQPCLTYASGLSAINAVFTALCPKKIAIGDGYHGSHGVLNIHKRMRGVEKLPLDCKPEELGAGDLILLETPVNPTGLAFDIQKYADIAHSRGAFLMVDSTFAPPPLQDPFRHGADIVMHSGTKYIGGHSDMLCGVVAVKRRDWLEQLMADRVFLGSVLGSLEGWLGVRSIRTLELRVMRQSETARRVVEALNGALTGRTVGTGLSQSDVETVNAVLKEVYHASLQTQDYKTWLLKQMPNGFGPVFSIAMHSEALAKHLPSKLRLFHHATSLGGVESLIEWRTMSDATVSRNILRVSIGIEDERDLLSDFLQAFRALRDELKV